MANATEKSKYINKLLDDLSKSIFGRSRRECIENNICVSCGKEAIKFRDRQARREYQISGLCDNCQNKIFGESS